MIDGSKSKGFYEKWGPGDHEFGGQFILQNSDGIFETGAYGVPSKSQNPTVLGQGGPYT